MFELWLRRLSGFGIRVSWTWKFWGYRVTWKYFTDAEVAGLVDNIPAMLDMARGLATQWMQRITGDPKADVPFILTFTTGGVHCGDSTHGKGLAVDIGLGHLDAGFSRDSQREAIVYGLLMAGFVRIEIAPAHIHADRGQPPEYPAPVMPIGTDS